MEQFFKLKERLEKQGHLVVGGEDEEDCGACKPRAGNLYGSDMRRRFRSQQRQEDERSASSSSHAPSSSTTSTTSGATDGRTSSASTTTSFAGTDRPQDGSRGQEEEQQDFYDEEGYWDKQEAPDVIELGQAGWTLLHSMAAHYPRRPSAEHKARMRTFLSLLPHLYPCRICAKDFDGILRETPPDVESRESLSLWMCRAHNHVNQQLGKPLFPCERVLERWLPPSGTAKEEELS